MVSGISEEYSAMLERFAMKWAPVMSGQAKVSEFMQDLKDLIEGAVKDCPRE